MILSCIKLLCLQMCTYYQYVDLFHVNTTLGCSGQDVSKYHLQVEPEIGDSFHVRCPEGGHRT